MRKTLSILAVIASFLLTSCGVYDQGVVVAFNPPKAQTSYDVKMSFDDAWDRIIDFFAERNLPIETIEKSSGLIVCKRSSFSHAYWTPQKGLIDSTAFIAIQHRSNYKLDGTGLSAVSGWNVRLKRIGDNQSKMTVNIVGVEITADLVVGYPPRLESVPQSDLMYASTGVFERMLYNYITTQDR